MLPIEALILIANICISPSTNEYDTARSVKCNQHILECMPKTLKKQFIKDGTLAFNQCYIEFETLK